VIDAARILVGDTIAMMNTLPESSVHCCVTSPPYWGLRDYGVDGQIGLEETPDAFIGKMVEVFRAVRRVLREDGTLWLNLGDAYAGGPKPKDLGMMPWRVALALQADGWWLRSVIVWAKKSPMPESVTDRPTSSWEPIFLMAKSDRYFYDAEAVKEEAINGGLPTKYHGGDGDRAVAMGRKPSGNERPDATPTIPTSRNQRNVWHLGPEPYSEAHFAVFPSEIPRRAIKAGTSEKGCCPSCGAPYRRKTERTQVLRERPNALTKRDGTNGTGNHCANTVAGVDVRTTGWTPTCGCAAGAPVPCVVLDPFLGSGTTVAVARELGRHGVGCELNPEYAELARRRIGKAERPLTFRDDRALDSPLFGGVA
jgi:DNA modification methylase